MVVGVELPVIVLFFVAVIKRWKKRVYLIYSSIMVGHHWRVKMSVIKAASHITVRRRE